MKRTAGFTLVEALVSAALIGVLGLLIAEFLIQAQRASLGNLRAQSRDTALEFVRRCASDPACVCRAILWGGPTNTELAECVLGTATCNAGAFGGAPVLHPIELMSGLGSRLTGTPTTTPVQLNAYGSPCVGATCQFELLTELRAQCGPARSASCVRAETLEIQYILRQISGASLPGGLREFRGSSFVLASEVAVSLALTTPCSR